MKRRQWGGVGLERLGKDIDFFPDTRAAAYLNDIEIT